MVTERVARFVAGTTASEIPAAALELARVAVTDFTGVALAGSREELSAIVLDYARRMGGAPQASIIGSDLRTSTCLAALVNGTMGHALDYDDMAISLIGHPSVFLVPAVLSIGEMTGASGKSALAAYVIGYEVACNIALPILQSHYLQGWHSTATFGALGATAASAWLLGLKEGQVKRALGIAASLAGGLRRNFGTMTKPLHAGQAAANGIEAALLAQAGFTADENIIEGTMGFAKAFGHTGEVDWGKAGEGIGKRFLITGAGGLSIKPYPVCGFTHCAVDAALKLRERHKMNIGNIAGVKLGVTPVDKQVLIYHQPATGLEGKFSLEYCVARALCSGEVRLKHLVDSAVAEPPVKRLMEKMTWEEKYPVPDMGTAGGFGQKSITLVTKGGQEYTAEVDIAKGMPQNPLTGDELSAKYRECAATVLDPERVEQSFAILARLDELRDIRELTGILNRK